MKRWDVLGIGCTTVDDLLYVDHFPAPDSKIKILGSERQGGGLTGVALVAAARAGALCAYGGQLGFGEYSQFVSELFLAEKIDLSVVQWKQEASPFHSTIVVDVVNNTRNVFFEKVGEVALAAEGLSEEIVAAARVLHVDHYGGSANAAACRAARRHQVPIVGDIERDNVEAFEEFFPLIDHLLVSRSFAARKTGCETPLEMARALWTKEREVVIVSSGARGCLVYTPQQAWAVPAYDVEVVDSTGCGDVFHGVYAAGLARGQDLLERVRRASAAAALKARVRGATKGCPLPQAIEEMSSRPLPVIPLG